MSLQTDSLAVAALGVGVHGDDLPDSAQPPLVDGVHLRWAFPRDLGFPWHGFHLFRRPARPGTPLCLSTVTGGLGEGIWPEDRVHTPIGVLAARGGPLVLERPNPDGPVVFALDGGLLRFDLPEGEPAHRVVVRIGFRDNCVDAARLLLSPGSGNLDLLPPESVPEGGPVLRDNPLSLQGMLFLVRGSEGTLAGLMRFDTIATTTGQRWGLGCGYGLTVGFSSPRDAVSLLVTCTAAPAIFEAFDGEGRRVAAVQTQSPPGQPETVGLNGQGIVRVEVRTSEDTVYLHRVCTAPAGRPSSVELRVLGGGTPLASVTVYDRPGETATATLEADALDAVEIGPGAAWLAELCYVPVAQEATEGWERVPGLTYPLGLPVSHPDYPCSVADPLALLAQRRRYPLPPEWEGTPPDWGGPSFTQLHDQLVALVEGGPGAAPMASRVFDAPSAVSDPPDPDPPRLSTFYVLDLVLLGALHPALAQLVGLYWVDQSAVSGTAYDYLVVADRTGAGQGDADHVLSVIQGSGFDPFDAFIAFNRRAAPSPPLASPEGLQAYALPAGGVFPDATGTLQPANGTAGLRWDVRWDDSGALLPERALMYLVWRAGLGDEATPGSAGAYELVTKLPSGAPKPVMVTGARLPRDFAPPRGAGWPADPFHFIDRNLPDGWYGYRVSGIDLFGRHSAAGAPALLRLLSATPPPAVTGVEAWVLDPEDPFVQRDAAFHVWQDGLDPSVRETQVGLRVRWTWTAAHQRQAPDTAEFRIYLHPGAARPADGERAAAWQQRLFVVGYAEQERVTVDAQSGDRHYQVFLPLSTAADVTPLPLEPTLAEPVIHAHVGVSAADAKPHAADPRTGGSLSGRPGNEGPVRSARVYRVLRAPPPAPEGVFDADRLYASPADYHARSFFTYRWKPVEHLKLHVFRALDDAVFQADRARRPAAQKLAPSQLAHFPGGWDQAARQAVADELNALDDVAGEENVVAMAAYRGLSDRALRVLAGLPGSEGAFGQLTLEPLDPAAAASANRLGPDDPDGLVVDPALRAWVDTLDGRATNRYLYRAALVDGAQNLGPLGPSSPPVYLPRVVPPQAPVLTRVRGGERQIELRWVVSREPGVSAYRVYRTDAAANTRDIRLMERVRELPVAALTVNRNEASWTDTAVPAGRDFHYRLTALDSESAPNESAPSKVVMGRAVDTVPPQAPELIALEWMLYDAAARQELPWPEDGAVPDGFGLAVKVTVRGEGAELRIYRKSASELTWRLAGRAAGQGERPNVFRDFGADPQVDAFYRAKAISQSSMVSQYSAVLGVTARNQ